MVHGRLRCGGRALRRRRFGGGGSVESLAGGHLQCGGIGLRRRTPAVGPVWRVDGELVYWLSCCSALFVDLTHPFGSRRNPAQEVQRKSSLRPGSSVVERGPEKAGVG